MSLRPLVLFLLLLLLFPAVSVLVGAVRDGFEDLAGWQWLLLLLLPVLAWGWWRYFSVFGCRAACRQPGTRRVDPDARG